MDDAQQMPYPEEAVARLLSTEGIDLTEAINMLSEDSTLRDKIRATKWATFVADETEFLAFYNALASIDPTPSDPVLAQESMVFIRKSAQDPDHRDDFVAVFDRTAMSSLIKEALQDAVTELLGLPSGKVLAMNASELKRETVCPACKGGAHEEAHTNEHGEHPAHEAGSCCSVNPITNKPCACTWRAKALTN